MNNLYQILNAGLKTGGDRQWLPLGQSIQISPERRVRLVCEHVNNQFIPVLSERVNTTVVKKSVVSDGTWLSMATRDGFTEICPRGLKFNRMGVPESVLIDVVKTPADQIFTH